GGKSLRKTHGVSFVGKHGFTAVACIPARLARFARSGHRLVHNSLVRVDCVLGSSRIGVVSIEPPCLKTAGAKT
ncbi:hypothetical protein, partial [Paraburkholderia silvatlantica]